MDLGYLIRRAARHYPDAPAVADRHGVRSLREVVDRAERLANSLDALGLPPGGVVGLLSENRVEYPEVDLGLALSGRVRVALNSRLAREDFRYSLGDAGAVALIHSGDFAEDAAELAADLGLMTVSLDDGDAGGAVYEDLLAAADSGPVQRDVRDEDPAWISYTSGTTGKPKGVVLSHRAVREVAFNVMLEVGPSVPGERIVLAQPLSHGAGYFVLPQLWAGGGVYIMRRFDAEEVVWAARQPGMVTLKVVPAMFSDLFRVHDGARDAPAFKTMIYGASPMPAPVLDEALERFGPVLMQIYGQTEAPVTLTCLHKHDHARVGPHRSSAGRPWRTVGLEVRDDDGQPVPPGVTGEVTITGSHLMTGYHRLPEATAEVLRDGWIWTRDIGTIDDEGYVHLLGRRDEMINSGGFNIAPREVELVIQDHPAVEECVVIGMPDERWGTAVGAVVRLRSGRAATIDELLTFARPRLTFRTPKRILLAPEIPKTPYGKTDRPRLLDALAADENGGAT